MTITIYPITEKFYQGSQPWFDARCGLLTASEMHLCISKAKLEVTDNDKVREHVWELAAQRITRYVEPSYLSDDMIRGHEAEEYAIMHYEASYGPVQRVCFATREYEGMTIGYSPDGLIGDRGTMEVKGPRQKGHLQTILAGGVPDKHVIQVQTGLWVLKRDFCEFVSYHGGMPMCTIRVEADHRVQEAIVRAALAFEAKVRDAVAEYQDRLKSGMRLVPTERVIEQEIY